MGFLLVFINGCKKDDDNNADNTPVVTPVVNKYLARYYNVGGSQWSLEFFNNDTAYYWVGDAHVSGAYEMTTSTHVKVHIGYFGEGDFISDFDTLNIAGYKWAK